MSGERRGQAPTDSRDFSDQALPLLRKAAGDIVELLDRGYPIRSVCEFVGNHYQLSARQRLALARSLASSASLETRREKEESLEDLAGKTVRIDGFNQIITIEIALCGSPLFLGMDGAVRDLAGLHGTYHTIGQTKRAAEEIFRILDENAAAGAVFYLDKPVSNSGRLKTVIAEAHEGFQVGLDFQVIRDVDAALSESEHVITSDSMILDRCRSWCSIGRIITERLGIEPIRLF